MVIITFFLFFKMDTCLLQAGGDGFSSVTGFFQNLVGDLGRFIPYHQQTIVFKVYLCHKDPHLTDGGAPYPN
jgi:hypothetical protein